MLELAGGGCVLAEERRNRLIELVRQRGFASLPALVEALAVSESTIRRDLDYLEEFGTMRRTHGGVFYTGQAPLLPHFIESQPANWDQKQAIARRAVELVQEGDSVLLDGGTTTYEVARLLVGRNLQIVTNSLPVANLFTASASTELIFLGGYIDHRSGVAMGPYTNEMLGQLNVSKTIMSVAAVHDRGFYNSNVLLVETERTMMRAADQVIIVADSSKFGRRSLQLLGPLADADHLVVDAELSPKWREKLAAAQVRVSLAASAGKNQTAEGNSAHQETGGSAGLTLSQNTSSIPGGNATTLSE
ncbi:MAG: DeoR/GlpR family DNA-binding transcription regulator [Pirellulales bacterium]|nr:DeoR/GlpR family DNA-binding transcription regulator [Pirellulales bacterium]